MPWSPAVTVKRSVLFAVEAVVSACVTGLLAAFAAKIAFTEFVAILGLFGFLLPFLVIMSIPFIAMPAIGLVTRRYGLVLGPVIFAVAVYAFTAVTLARNEQAVISSTNATIKPASMDHRLLAIDERGQGTTCDDACMRFIATSGHRLALKDDSRRSPDWIVYAHATGEVCFAKENAKLALEFLVRGFPGTCATREVVASFGDALLLRVSGPSAHPAPDLPVAFTGTVTEAFEKVDGQERLLARRISGAMGRLSDAAFLVEKKPRRLDVGPPIDKIGFLANAVGSDVGTFRSNKTPDPFPFDEVLDGIESYIDRGGAIAPETMRYARWAWGQIATNGQRRQIELVKRRMLKLFATRDPSRIELALGQAYLPLDARVFSDADDLMLDLLFIPVSDRSTPLLERVLDGQFAYGRRPPLSADLHDRARAHLNDPDLKPWQQRMLQRIVDS